MLGNDGLDQTREIFRHGRIRMVVWKSSVHLEEQFGRLAIELLKNPPHDRPRGAVTAVRHYSHPPLELKWRADFIHVRGNNVHRFFRSLSGAKIAPLDHPAQ